MIHNLFDEYRFFAKYPDKELAITAALFGGLVQRDLVAGRWLDLALRYMLVSSIRQLTGLLVKAGAHAQVRPSNAACLSCVMHAKMLWGCRSFAGHPLDRGNEHTAVWRPDVRCAVQDAARSPPGSKLFTFARSSLQHCHAALRAWPHYCAHLLQVLSRPCMRC